MQEVPAVYWYCPFCGKALEVKTEEHRERKHCPSCQWTHYPTPSIAVAAVVTEFRQEKNLQPCVLMVRRNREPFKGTWMFPAGFLEWGEHPEDTLIRELREETGLIAVYSINLWRVERSINDPRSPEHLVIFYRVQARGDVINNDADENLAVQWKSIDEPIEIGFPVHKGIFNRIKDRPGDFFDY